MRIDLEKKAFEIIAAAAQKGVYLKHGTVYGRMKDKLGSYDREPKEAAVLDGDALEEHWRQQMGESKWDSLTVEAAKELVPTQPLTGSVYAQSVIAGMPTARPIPQWNYGKSREAVGRER